MKKVIFTLRIKNRMSKNAKRAASLRSFLMPILDCHGACAPRNDNQEKRERPS